MRLIDLTGRKFHRLTVLKRSPINNSQNKPLWICKCECGNITVVSGSDLKSGNTKSCGCWNIESATKRFYKHGKTRTRLYYIWCGIKDRCYNPNNPRYNDYGGRGIKMDETWRNDFSEFQKWAIENGYDENAPFGQCTIDRANNQDGYFPFNCVWTTIAQQNRNKRNVSNSQIYLTKKSKRRKVK